MDNWAWTHRNATRSKSDHSESADIIGRKGIGGLRRIGVTACCCVGIACPVGTHGGALILRRRDNRSTSPSRAANANLGVLRTLEALGGGLVFGAARIDYFARIMRHGDHA